MASFKLHLGNHTFVLGTFKLVEPLPFVRECIRRQYKALYEPGCPIHDDSRITPVCAPALLQEAAAY